MYWMQDELYMFMEICEKWLLVQKMKEIFKVSYDILLYLEKKNPYIFISK